MIRILGISAIAALLHVAILGLLTACAGPQGVVKDGEYTSPNRMFSVRIPRPSNPFGVPYAVTPLDTKGDSQYDKVMFHVADFGTYLVASARVMPAASVPLMDKDDHRTVLRNVSRVSLMAWRTDLEATPEIVRESFVDSQYGEAIVRVYRIRKGSLLVQAQGRRPTREDAFDTNIASVVARQGPVVVYVLAENDTSPNDTGALVKMAIYIFRDMKVPSSNSAPHGDGRER